MAKHYDEHLKNPENRIRFQEEALLLNMASLIHLTMKRKGVTPKQLADELGVTKGRVSQYLCGERNLRLRTLADIFTALGCRIKATAEDLSADGIHWQSMESPVQLPRKWNLPDRCLGDSISSMQLAG